MSLKDKFTPDEWFQVMTGPGRVGAAVVAASPSGVTGLVAEAQAIAGAVREQIGAAGRTPLLEAMAADLMGTPPDAAARPPEERARNMDEARARSVESVRQVVWLVGSKAGPEDLAAYRRLLLSVAERTAGAAREGGFLGLGGEQINEKERAVLEELRAVIGGEETTGTGIQGTLPVNPDGSGNSG